MRKMILTALLCGCGGTGAPDMGELASAGGAPGPASGGGGAGLTLGSYEIGTPTLTDLWVDPVGGSDSNSGASASQAMRTVTAAWNAVPSNTTLSTTGYRIRLMPGSYPASSVPNYWESRHGTYACPILLSAADGPGTVTLKKKSATVGSFRYNEVLPVLKQELDRLIF